MTIDEEDGMIFASYRGTKCEICDFKSFQYLEHCPKCIAKFFDGIKEIGKMKTE